MPSDSRGRLCGSRTSGVTAGTGRAVDEGGAKFIGSRGWFVDCGKVVGDFLCVVVLVIVVVQDVTRLSAVVWSFRRRVLRVVRELAPDGTENGADPVVERGFALSFR